MLLCQQQLSRSKKMRRNQMTQPSQQRTQHGSMPEEATSLASEASLLSQTLHPPFCHFISERRLFLRHPGNAAIQEGLPAPLCSVSDVIQRFCTNTKRLTTRRADDDDFFGGCKQLCSTILVRAAFVLRECDSVRSIDDGLSLGSSLQGLFEDQLHRERKVGHSVDRY